MSHQLSGAGREVLRDRSGPPAQTATRSGFFAEGKEGATRHPKPLAESRRTLADSYKNTAHPAVDATQPGELPAADSGLAAPQHMGLPA